MCSAISSPPLIAGFNYQLPGTDLPPGSLNNNSKLQQQHMKQQEGVQEEATAANATSTADSTSTKIRHAKYIARYAHQSTTPQGATQQPLNTMAQYGTTHTKPSELDDHHRQRNRYHFQSMNTSQFGRCFLSLVLTLSVPIPKNIARA